MLVLLVDVVDGEVLVEPLLHHDDLELEPDQIGVVDLDDVEGVKDLGGGSVVRHYLVHHTAHLESRELALVVVQKQVVLVAALVLKRVHYFFALDLHPVEVLVIHHVE